MPDVGESPAGLCATCRHTRRVESARGSTFWLCARSADDPRFPKYPRLPVLRCPGFEPTGEPGVAPAGEPGPG
jgi:hypothetical protein